MLEQSAFRPAWWLKNRHLQTIIPNLLRRQPRLALRRERVELPDGDFVDADWVGTRQAGPIVVLLHGLEGSIKSRYASGMLKALDDAGYRPVIMHCRSCSGEINRRARAYHSGHTEDFEYFFKLVRAREPATPLAAIGYSLSGNAILKWLAENPQQDLLVTAVAVSVPFDLQQCSDTISRGFSRLYEIHLMRRLNNTARKKLHLIKAEGLDPDIDSLRTFAEFDDALTAPLHGFRDARDYYTRCSSAPLLKRIETPVLILHARDDPFMLPETVPTADMLSPAVTLELSDSGGHCGFVSGRWPWRAEFWSEQRILARLAEFL